MLLIAPRLFLCLLLAFSSFGCRSLRQVGTVDRAVDDVQDTMEAFGPDISGVGNDSLGDPDFPSSTPDLDVVIDEDSENCSSCDQTEADSAEGPVVQVQVNSSQQPCLCWKHGGNCDLWGVGPIAPWNQAKVCPADELCDGDTGKLNPVTMEVNGTCRKVCALEGAGVQEARSCSPAEVCILTKIHGQSDMGPIATVAFCYPKVDGPQGGIQDAGTGEK